VAKRTEKDATKLDQSLTDIATFSQTLFEPYKLRPYQLEPAQAIIDGARRDGEQHVVVFSRQSGKDELLAQVVAYELARNREQGGSIVLAAPSFKPQGAEMRERLLQRLRDLEPFIDFSVREGYIVQVGNASARFLSASPLSNVRGQTASLLLVANEAQDIEPDVWDAAFAPMAASTNATKVFMGTVWSRDTLLARQMRHVDAITGKRGGSRVWKVTWQTVADVIPAYQAHVEDREAQMGRDHPFVKTEYYLEELDGAGALFSEQVLAQLQGDHPRQQRAVEGSRYALLIDVAGESETPITPGMVDWSSRRDSTALTVVEVCHDASLEAYGKSAVYRVVDRLAWTGESHASLHGRIVDLARNVWRASVVVVDATGVGAGLASFLKAQLGNRSEGRRAIQVVPFTFTGASKSKLGWDFLGLIQTGRFKEYQETMPPDSPEANLTQQFWSQMRSIRHDVKTGPGMLMQWSAPKGEGHDDLVVSAALAVVLDGYDFRLRIARGSKQAGWE
jgi:hypothetical protein